MKRVITVIISMIVATMLTCSVVAEEGKWVGVLRIIDDQLEELVPTAKYNSDGVQFVPPAVKLEHAMGGLLYNKPVSTDSISLEIRVDNLEPKDDLKAKWIGIGIVDKPVLNPSSPDQGNGLFMLLFINASGVVNANAYLYLENNESGLPQTVTVNANVYDGGIIKVELKKSMDGYSLKVNDKEFQYAFTELKSAFPDGMANVTVAAYSHTAYSKSDFTIVGFNDKNPSTGGKITYTKSSGDKSSLAAEQSNSNTLSSTGGEHKDNNFTIILSVILSVIVIALAVFIVMTIKFKKKQSLSNDKKSQ